MSYEAKQIAKERLTREFPNRRFHLQLSRCGQKKEIFSDIGPHNRFVRIASEFTWLESFQVAKRFTLVSEQNRP